DGPGADVVLDAFHVPLDVRLVDAEKPQEILQQFVAFLDAPAQLFPFRRQRQAAVALVDQVLLIVQTLHHAGDGRRLHVEGGRDVADAGVALFLDQLVNPFQVIFDAGCRLLRGHEVESPSEKCASRRCSDRIKLRRRLQGGPPPARAGLAPALRECSAGPATPSPGPASSAHGPAPPSTGPAPPPAPCASAGALQRRSTGAAPALHRRSIGAPPAFHRRSTGVPPALYRRRTGAGRRRNAGQTALTAARRGDSMGAERGTIA